jgi:glycine dehydrogenase
MLTADTCYYLIQEKGSLPLEYVADNKFWPSVRRVDETYGDRNLICSCAPIEAYICNTYLHHSKMPRHYRGIFF